jgi:hypothetical protein
MKSEFADNEDLTSQVFLGLGANCELPGSLTYGTCAYLAAE